MIRKVTRKIKRLLGAKELPFVRNPRYPAYWWNRVLGGKPAQIVQIGSNDGKTGDPLHELLLTHPNWRALLVEPLPDIFARLRANYPQEERFQLANVAINSGEDLPFYYVDAPAAKAAIPDLPYWFDQLGSFDRQHIAKELDGALEPFIKSRHVTGSTLPALLKNHAVEKIDVLHIDVEGYDWKVLAQLDQQRYQPTFILYEHNHLSPEEFAAAADFLREDYHLFQINIDVLAVKKNLDAEVLTAMHQQLRPLAN